MAKAASALKRLTHHAGLRWSLLALLVYTVTTLVIMYPVPFQLNSVVAGEEHNDGYAYVWQLWWTRQALSDPDKGLAHIPLMNHPAGVDHPFMLTMVGLDLMALPLSMVLSPPAVYNCMVLLSFILTGMTMYWLCAEWTADRRAGLVGGFIFAFFLNKTGHVYGGHLPQAMTFWFPLYVLFLRRLMWKPRWLTAILTAFMLAMSSLIHVMHLIYFILPVTGVMLLVALAEMGRSFFSRRRLGLLVLAVGLAALVVVPALWPALRASAADNNYLYKGGIVKSSIDLLAFFTPSRYHPILGPLGLLPSYTERVFREKAVLREGLAYPGVLALGLAVWGLVRRWRQAWLWGALALLAAILALGPLLNIAGGTVSYQVDQYQSLVVLPYALFKELPVLEAGRTPGRLIETTMFAVAILAAFGVAGLSAWLGRRQRLLAVLVALLIAGTGFEYLMLWPFPAGSAAIPPVIYALNNEPGRGAILHIPTSHEGLRKQALLYQTVALRPIVGGFVHRITPEVPPWAETLSGLAQPEQTLGDIVPRPDGKERVAWLRHFDVDYIILHKGEPEGYAENLDYARALLGAPQYEDEELLAFPVPADAPAPESPTLYTLSAVSEEGWLVAEQDGGLWRRWLCENGWLYLVSARADVGSLRFAVDSNLEFPVLDLYQGDRLVDSLVISGPGVLTTRPVTLTQGMNTFQFRARAGGNTVVDNPQCWSDALSEPSEGESPLLCDPGALRTVCRTLVFDRVSFVPRGDLLGGEGLDVNLGDQIRLRGWEQAAAEVHPGESLTVTLAWEATVELSDRYIVFVHVLSPEGALVAQQDEAPVTRLSPAARPVETVFRYPVTVQLPDDLPAGEYQIVAGVYLWPGLERLEVRADVPGADSRVVELGSVKVELPAD